MPDLFTNEMIDDAVAEALQLDLAFLTGPGISRHVPFAVTPCLISEQHYQQLRAVTAPLGVLTQALATQHQLLQDTLAPLAAGDAFFKEMLSAHREVHLEDKPALRREINAMRGSLGALELDSLDLIGPLAAAYRARGSVLKAPLAHWSAEGNRLIAEWIAAHLEAPDSKGSPRSRQVQ